MKKERKTGELKKKIAKGVLTVYTMLNGLMLSMTVQAGALETTKLVSGTKALLSDISKVLLGITAVVVIVLLMWQGIAYANSGDDDGSREKHKKNGRSILIAGIVILCAEGLVTTVFGYFK